MRYTSGFLVLAAVGSMIMPLHAEAQSRDRQVRQGDPLVLRVTPRRYRNPGTLAPGGPLNGGATSYGQSQSSRVGSSYVPMNAFDPIEGVPPLGLGANNITITLPVSSRDCYIEIIKGIRYASTGCLDLSYGASR
jgi:hypothetical protein